MIRVLLSPSNLAEKRYTLDVLLGSLLGLSYSLIPTQECRDVVLQLENGNTLAIEDHFFGNQIAETDYLSARHVPKQVEWITNDLCPEGNLPVIFGSASIQLTDRAIRCGIDLIASSFFLLTRWEETVQPFMRDIHQRFPASASLAFKCQFLTRPIVNEYAEMCWNLLLHLGCGQKRRPRHFSFVLTHDVDQPWRWRNFGHVVKESLAQLIKRQSVKEAVRCITNHFAIKAQSISDPFDTFSELMDIAENANTRAEFYLMAGGNTKYDFNYPLTDPRMVSLIETISDRGHVIGFHPSYVSACQPDVWRKEYEALCRVLPEPPKVGRQHYLRLFIPETWQIWEDFGMTSDSSAGYADVAGFRCGICDPFPVFNVLTRSTLKLIERSIIAMEGTFIQYEKLSPANTYHAFSHLVQVVRKYQGQFVLLWHNSSFGVDPWIPYQHIYRQVVSSLSSIK